MTKVLQVPHRQGNSGLGSVTAGFVEPWVGLPAPKSLRLEVLLNAYSFCSIGDDKAYGIVLRAKVAVGLAFLVNTRLEPGSARGV